MGRNKKLTRSVRERMARTGENYTEARTRLLADGAPPAERPADPPAEDLETQARRELFRLVSVEDLEAGDGEAAQVWRTLTVRYRAASGDRVLDATGERPKVFALGEDYTGWMRALVGLRVGGVRRIEGDLERWGRCTIEARLLAVEPYVPAPAQELISGIGAPAARGDRVRVRYELHLRDVGSTLVASSGESGLWFTIGVGEVEPDLERVVVGMRVGGTRTAVLPPKDAGPTRWLWLELLDLG